VLHGVTLGEALWWRSTVKTVKEVGNRRRSLPAPPHVLFEALTQPNRDPQRQWLLLLEDEMAPRVVEARQPVSVTWSSLWTKRPDAIIHFDLPREDGGLGTDLRWTLHLDDPLPDAAMLGHMRKRINVLINANLRYSFGQ
jgi:hypothetical protein